MSVRESPSNAAGRLRTQRIPRLYRRGLHPGDAAHLEGHTDPAGRKIEGVGIPVATQHPRSAERRVSRERKLADRSEDSNPRLVGEFPHDERRLREVHLQSDGLHCRGIEVTGAADHRQLVAGQRTLCKDVDDRAVQGRPLLRTFHFSHFPRYEGTIIEQGTELPGRVHHRSA